MPTPSAPSPAEPAAGGGRRSVTAQAPGKVNLSLQVGPPREDGYHPVATVYLAVDLIETVTATVRQDGEVTVGPDPTRPSAVDTESVPWDGSNLAVKAALRLRDALGLDPETHGVDLAVAKQVPVAGGMGGGSADAAAALAACAALWDTGLGRSELAALAADLGADVPFAVTGGAAVGLGTGTELHPVPVGHDVHLVLVPASAELSTPRVFGVLDRLREEGIVPVPERLAADPELLAALTSGDPALLAGRLENHLQVPAVTLLPELADVLDLGLDEGALRTLVSGSGPTLFMLAADAGHAADLAAAVQERAGVAAFPVRGPVPGARVL